MKKVIRLFVVAAAGFFCSLLFLRVSVRTESRQIEYSMKMERHLATITILKAFPMKFCASVHFRLSFIFVICTIFYHLIQRIFTFHILMP